MDNEQTQLILKPKEDTKFAHEAAKILKDIVKQNGWSIRLGGKSEHLMYEAWQTIGKYYGYTVKTGDARYVEYGDAKGFEATATVIDNKTGLSIGGAEAICLNDEVNWKSKPLFQLKSMAQTRAGSKALRQILGFVVALAGYSPTPAEEMTEPETLKVIEREPRAKAIGKMDQIANECIRCTKIVEQRVKAWSLDKYGAVLCRDCQELPEYSSEYREDGE